MQGVLYIVATPIGNLSDITFRALEILKSVNLILAEDTRTSEPLLHKYEIKTKVSSYHKFNEKEKTDNIIQKLKSGENLALISDAGTPLISDPGNILVDEAIKNNIKVVPIGGISAITTFLSSISRHDEDFKFIGFLPRIKNQIENILKENRRENLVFYESPLRIKETLEIVSEFNKNAEISIGRELTKKFEEIKTGNIKEIIDYYEKNPLKGEIVCMIHKNEPNDTLVIEEKVKALIDKNFSQKDIATILDITDKACKNLVKEIYLRQKK